VTLQMTFFPSNPKLVYGGPEPESDRAIMGALLTLGMLVFEGH